jgi:hypothetical protein
MWPNQADNPGVTHRKPRLSWHHYLIATLLACALPWLAMIVEMILTWNTQMHLAGHFGVLFTDPHAWLLMAIPAAREFRVGLLWRSVQTFETGSELRYEI